jgi:hypothetical protein
MTIENSETTCRHCGIACSFPDPTECTGCFELRTRIEGDPKLARVFLEQAEAKQEVADLRGTITGRSSSTRPAYEDVRRTSWPFDAVTGVPSYPRN